MPSSRLTRTLVGVALGFLATVSGAAPASAHAGFVSAAPGPCDVLADVTRIVVDFDQPIVADRSGLEVVDAAGDVVASGEAVADSMFGGTLAAELERSLPPGDYRVAWRNVSLVDSDPARGAYGFTVGGSDAIAAAGCGQVTGDDAAATGDGGGAPLLAIVAVGVVVVGAAAALVVLRRRPTPTA